MKMIYAKILCKDQKETLMKDLVAIYKIKNTFLINNKFIKICYDNWADKYLKVKWIEDLV